jgi:hypothetical protein
MKRLTAALLTCGIFAGAIPNGALDRWRYPPWIQPLAPRRESTRPWRTSRSADRQLRARRHSRGRVFHRRTPGLAVRTRRELGPTLLAAAGIVVAGIVPTNPALEYPPGEPSVVTPSSVVHQIAGLFLFGGLSGAAFVLAPRLRAASRSWAPTPGSRAYSSSSSRSPLASPTGSTPKESGNRHRQVRVRRLPWCCRWSLTPPWRRTRPAGSQPPARSPKLRPARTAGFRVRRIAPSPERPLRPQSHLHRHRLSAAIVDRLASPATSSKPVASSIGWLMPAHSAPRPANVGGRVAQAAFAGPDLGREGRGPTAAYWLTGRGSR